MYPTGRQGCGNPWRPSMGWRASQSFGLKLKMSRGNLFIHQLSQTLYCKCRSAWCQAYIKIWEEGGNICSHEVDFSSLIFQFERWTISPKLCALRCTKSAVLLLWSMDRRMPWWQRSMSTSCMRFENKATFMFFQERDQVFVVIHCMVEVSFSGDPFCRQVHFWGRQTQPSYEIQGSV